MQKIVVNSKEEMAGLACKIAASATLGSVFGLKGTLGAGKSFFAKNFINSLQKNLTEVLSPTFNLVYSYDTKKGEVFHFDLYRLKSEEELENIGFFDAMKSGICLIEWPEIAEVFLKKNYFEIEIRAVAGGEEEVREVLFKQNLSNK